MAGARIEPARASELDKLSAGTAQLLSALLKEEISPQQALNESDALVARMKQWQLEHQKLPNLLETLKTMEPKAIAAILTGGDASLGEDRATMLLSGLAPRKAGQVLTEMGKIDPNRAARIIARLGDADSPRVANNLNEAP